MPFTYGYARVSTDGQTLDAQVARLEAAGASKLFKEKVSGAKRDRVQLDKMLAALNAGDVVIVTRLDRLARSTRDLLNILGVVADKGATFRSLGDGWADDDCPWPADADGARRPGGIRARTDPLTHRRRARSRKGPRR